MSLRGRASLRAAILRAEARDSLSDTHKNPHPPGEQMRSFRRVLLIATAVILVMPLTGQDRTITIHVGTLPDGKGGVQKNTNAVAERSIIVSAVSSSMNP